MPGIVHVQTLGASYEIERALMAQGTTDNDVLSDANYFEDQQRVLEGQHLQQAAAKFDVVDSNTGKRTSSKEVLVRAPLLKGNVQEEYKKLLEALARSGLKLRSVDFGAELSLIFKKRAIEFINSRPKGLLMSLTKLPQRDTIVETNREGDTVIFSKGYFVSTGMALGVLSAQGYMAPGIYSFGILENGAPNYEDVLWEVFHDRPTHVRLHKPWRIRRIC